jgi:hypothetical protein
MISNDLENVLRHTTRRFRDGRMNEACWETFAEVFQKHVDELKVWEEFARPLPDNVVRLEARKRRFKSPPPTRGDAA